MERMHIGGSGGACPAHTPLWDPILSFLHTFSPKSAHIRGPCPPNGCMPPTGNPGYATDAYLVMKNPRASRAVRWALDPSQ